MRKYLRLDTSNPNDSSQHNEKLNAAWRYLATFFFKKADRLEIRYIKSDEKRLSIKPDINECKGNSAVLIHLLRRYAISDKENNMYAGELIPNGHSYMTLTLPITDKILQILLDPLREPNSHTFWFDVQLYKGRRILFVSHDNGASVLIYPSKQEKTILESYLQKLLSLEKPLIFP
jgi:hypothetical protein